MSSILQNLLLAEHSKAQATKVVNWVGHSPARFNELVTVFLGTDKLLVQRAAWPLSYAAEAHPDLLQKHIGKLIRNLRRPALHDAVKRNTLRCFRNIPVPKRYQGEMMNACFDFIIAPAEKPAIKAFSLAILANLAREYPDIRAEIKTIIEEKWDIESPAFRSQARKLLKSSRPNG
ncbi:MAG: hypothetical protein IPP73_03430 [Chitinophagaceae bacterium]|nr:hypothetical protein [Chitinophagaceae bacterium]